MLKLEAPFPWVPLPTSCCPSPSPWPLGGSSPGVWSEWRGTDPPWLRQEDRAGWGRVPKQQAGSPTSGCFATSQLEKGSVPLLITTASACGPHTGEEGFVSQTWMAGSPILFHGSTWGETEYLTCLSASVSKSLGPEEPASLTPGPLLGVLKFLSPPKTVTLRRAGFPGFQPKLMGNGKLLEPRAGNR